MDHKLVLAFVAVFLVSALLLHTFTGRFHEKFPRYPVQVVRVIDGDTFLASNGETVRLLGVNTPDKGMKYYEEASSTLRELVENKTVYLEWDSKDKDAYGRSLRYVFLGDMFVNSFLLEAGYAHTFMLDNLRYKNDLLKSQQVGIERSVGVWNKSEFFGCISIRQLMPKEELLEIESKCGDINVSGWILKDEANNLYIFPPINIKSIRIHSGYGEDNQTDLFWGKKYIWNDDGDTVFLYDMGWKLVLMYQY